MGVYRLHRGWREPNGLVTDHVSSDQIISATCARDAMAVALADGTFLIADDANLAWLIDERGNMVWSLRLDDPETALNG